MNNIQWVLGVLFPFLLVAVIAMCYQAMCYQFHSGNRQSRYRETLLWCNEFRLNPGEFGPNWQAE